MQLETCNLQLETMQLDSAASTLIVPQQTACLHRRIWEALQAEQHAKRSSPAALMAALENSPVLCAYGLIRSGSTLPAAAGAAAQGSGFKNQTLHNGAAQHIRGCQDDLQLLPCAFCASLFVQVCADAEWQRSAVQHTCDVQRQQGSKHCSAVADCFLVASSVASF